MEPHDGCYDDDDDYGDAYDECYDEGDSCYSDDDDDEVARVLALENRRIERENRSLDDADDDDERGGNHEV